MSIEFKIIATEISVKCTQMNKIAKKLEAARCAIPGGGEVGMAEGVGGAGSAAGASFGGASLLGGAAEGAEAPPLKTKTCTPSNCKIFLKWNCQTYFPVAQGFTIQMHV